MLLVLSAPVAGREVAFNDWYDNQHLSEVLAIPGFVSARRYRSEPITALTRPRIDQSYAAIYEISGSLEAAMERLIEAVGRGDVVLPDCIDQQTLSITPMVPLTRGGETA